MKVTLSTGEWPEKILEHEFPDNFCVDDSLQEGEYATRLPFGQGRVQHSLFDGTLIQQGSYDVFKPITFHTEADRPVLGMHFNLQGEIEVQLRGDKKAFLCRANEYNLCFNPNPGETLYAQEAHYEVIEIQFSPEQFIHLTANTSHAFDQIIQAIACERLFRFDENVPISPMVRSILFQIRHCPLAGGLRRLFLQAKIMELLCLQVQQIEGLATQTDTKSLTAQEAKLMLQAKDILLADLRYPPTLAELAKELGINDFKLKKQFKRFFGISVYAYLINHRMELASRLLLERSHTVSEIAGMAGYKSIAHFSQAFKKRFGISPSQYAVSGQQLTLSLL